MDPCERQHICPTHGSCFQYDEDHLIKARSDYSMTSHVHATTVTTKNSACAVPCTCNKTKTSGQISANALASTTSPCAKAKSPKKPRVDPSHCSQSKAQNTAKKKRRRATAGPTANKKNKYKFKGPAGNKTGKDGPDTKAKSGWCSCCPSCC